ncbi:MAG: hypothetical protein IJS28_01385 [Synergistaceae bacterium]|nr:hypothetical protein [Synergistaceae bacterium]
MNIFVSCGEESGDIYAGDTVANCMGTLSSTLIVAASENMLDKEEYSKP